MQAIKIKIANYKITKTCWHYNSYTWSKVIGKVMRIAQKNNAQVYEPNI